MSVKYATVYAKISIDKREGIILHGVYFGGIADTHSEAEQIARDCVNNTRSCTILPKIIIVDGDHKLIDVLYDAEERFENIVKQMKEADATINNKRAM